MEIIMLVAWIGIAIQLVMGLSALLSVLTAPFGIVMALREARRRDLDESHYAVMGGLCHAAFIAPLSYLLNDMRGQRELRSTAVSGYSLLAVFWFWGHVVGMYALYQNSDFLDFYLEDGAFGFMHLFVANIVTVLASFVWATRSDRRSIEPEGASVRLHHVAPFVLVAAWSLFYMVLEIKAAGFL